MFREEKTSIEIRKIRLDRYFRFLSIEIITSIRLDGFEMILILVFCSWVFG